LLAGRIDEAAAEASFSRDRGGAGVRRRHSLDVEQLGRLRSVGGAFVSAIAVPPLLRIRSVSGLCAAGCSTQGAAFLEQSAHIREVVFTLRQVERYAIAPVLEQRVLLGLHRRFQPRRTTLALGQPRKRQAEIVLRGHRWRIVAESHSALHSGDRRGMSRSTIRTTLLEAGDSGL
jgi:hypothetical protein